MKTPRVHSVPEDVPWIRRGGVLQPQPMKKEAAEERSSQRKEVSEGRKGPSDTYNFAYILYQGLCLNR